MANQDFIAEERKAGNRAAGLLRAAVHSVNKSTFKTRSGALEKSNVSARYREGRLDRLVLTAPHYSFKNHYGSTKTGTTPAYSRGGANVRSFQRFMGGGRNVQQVQAHKRAGGAVRAHRKGKEYTAYHHIAKALNGTNALNELATALGNNRIVEVTSKIDFR